MDLPHAVIRLDGPDGPESAPPSWASVDLPLPQICVTALQLRLKERELAKRAAGELWTDSDFVFTTRYGTPYEPRNFNRLFVARSAKAGVHPRGMPKPLPVITSRGFEMRGPEGIRTPGPLDANEVRYRTAPQALATSETLASPSGCLEIRSRLVRAR